MAGDLRMKDTQGEPSLNALRVGLQLGAAGIGVLVALSLVSRAAGPAGGASARIVPTQSTGPSLDFGTPPSGVAVFYYVDSRQPSWLVASDWLGKPRGTVKRSPDDGVFPLYASPDGSSVVVGQTIYQHGRRWAAWQTGRGLAAWADDSRHMCGFAAAGTGAGRSADSEVLQTWEVSKEPTTIATIGSASSRAGAYVLACSVRTNRVLAVSSGPTADTAEYWLVTLPSGVILHDEFLRSGPGSAYTDLVASPDARYMAQTLMQPGSSGPVALSAAIHDAASGAALARLAAGKVVVRFSADGESVLVADSNSNRVSVVRWRTGQTLWALSVKDLADPHEVLMTSIAKPGGGGFVLAFWRPQTGSCPGGAATCTTADANPVQELLLVGADGTHRIVARHVTLVASGY